MFNDYSDDVVSIVRKLDNIENEPSGSNNFDYKQYHYS